VCVGVFRLKNVILMTVRTQKEKTLLSHLKKENPHWVRLVDYGPFSLCVIHNESLCPSSGGINRLMKKENENISLKDPYVRRGVHA
jgi:hypothetical protein